MHALASIGRLDLLDSFQLGMNSRNNSLHLGRDNSFSNIASLIDSSGSNKQWVDDGRRRSRRVSGGSASILGELAKAAKDATAIGHGGSVWINPSGARRGSLQPFPSYLAEPQNGAVGTEGSNPRRVSLRVALDDMAQYTGLTAPRPIPLAQSKSNQSKKKISKQSPRKATTAGKAKKATTNAKKPTKNSGAKKAATNAKKPPKNSGTKRKARSEAGGSEKRSKQQKRASNREFEARRRNRVNAAMNQLKKICSDLGKGKQNKNPTKIEVLEQSIQLLRDKRKEEPMDFQAEYDAADSTTKKEVKNKAIESGAADIQRSIRERKRRIKVNILEKEIARLALASADAVTCSTAHKCMILERACEVLGQPVSKANK